MHTVSSVSDEAPVLSNFSNNLHERIGWGEKCRSVKRVDQELSMEFSVQLNPLINF